MTETLSLRYAAHSDVGRVRKDNQDSGYASENLLVIADGVGGAARGDIASRTAVQILSRLDEPAPDDMLEALAGSIHRAHDRIAELVEEDPALEGTSTTVTAALFDGARIGIGHVGDSRGYLRRDGELSQLTRDHTFVQSLIDEGRITEEEAVDHPHRNLILRAVDGVSETDPDLFLVDLAPGDRILLCSDGCSGVLDRDRMSDILGTGTADYAVVELIRAALDAGSSDNVTCVVADVVNSTEAVDQESAATAAGPMLVGAAAEQPRETTGSGSRFRGHRSGDTGELDPVAVEDDDVDPEVLRYAPRPPARLAWLRRLAVLLAVAGVLALIAYLGYRWTQNQYYVAAADDRVAIYQGVQVDIPGVTLTSVEEGSQVTLAALSTADADRVRDGIVADDLPDARDIVSNIGSQAKVCRDPKPTPTPTPDTGPTGGPQDGGQTGGPSDGNQNENQNGNPEPNPPDPQPSPDDSPTPDPQPTLSPPDCIEAAP